MSTGSSERPPAAAVVRTVTGLRRGLVAVGRPAGMERDPTDYSRPLVVLGLGGVLLLDLTAGLGTTTFIGAGVAVLLAAAAVHFLGDEPQAAAGWAMFALALGFFGMLDVRSSTVSLLAIGSLLVAGLALQLSERIQQRTDST